MARIDCLLDLLLRYKMERLILEPGHRPCLQTDDRTFAAARTELSGPGIDQLVREIAPPTAKLDGAAWEFVYRHRDDDFHVSRTGGPGDPRVQIRWRPEPEDDKAAAKEGPLGIRRLLLEMVERGASDLHVSSGQEPRLRVSGDLCPVPGYDAPCAKTLERELLEIAPPANRDQYLAESDTDFAIEIPGKGRFRANYFRDRSGIGAVFRQIPTEIPSFEQLDLPAVLRSLVHLSKGLVLVTGPTGSGKSTTLAALLDLINRSRADHIITIEDPVEFVHRSRRCLVHQREVGTHTRSFSSALRASLREDPDVVLVGELRDLETTAIAIKTAETGHLVFGTLHTTSAPATVERLIDQFPEGQQGQIRLMLASSLVAVVSQVLLKRTGGGRVAAFEILLGNPAVANLIREGKVFQIPSAMQTGRGQGMRSLDESLLDLVVRGVADPEEAYRKGNDKKELLARMRAARVDLSFLGEAAREEEQRWKVAGSAA